MSYLKLRISKRFYSVLGNFPSYFMLSFLRDLVFFPVVDLCQFYIFSV